MYVTRHQSSHSENDESVMKYEEQSQEILRLKNALTMVAKLSHKAQESLHMEKTAYLDEIASLKEQLQNSRIDQ